MTDDKKPDFDKMRRLSEPGIATELLRWGALLVVAGLSFYAIYSVFPILNAQFKICYPHWIQVPSPTSNNDLEKWCLDPNEIGDLLAGVFASLAFLCLAYTILLQWLELSAQRKELRLTNWIAEQQRLALIEQDKTMKIALSIEQRQQGKRDLDTLVARVAERIKIIRKIQGQSVWSDASATSVMVDLKDKMTQLIKACAVAPPTHDIDQKIFREIEILLNEYLAPMSGLPANLNDVDLIAYRELGFLELIEALKYFQSQQDRISRKQPDAEGSA